MIFKSMDVKISLTFKIPSTCLVVNLIYKHRTQTFII